MNDEIIIKTTVDVDTSQLDEAITKYEKLNSIMKETRKIVFSLASDINSIDLKVDVNV